MQQLTIDPPIPFVIPNWPIRILLIGCGGTGSHIAQALARLAIHAQQVGQTIMIGLLDGDTVEPKNVGRQLFSESDVGHNKAQILAARFNAVFGLRITAFPTFLREGVEIDSFSDRRVNNILVGAVDTAAGRRAIARWLNSPSGHITLWLDCGNHETSGQVVAGAVTTRTQLRGVLTLGGICAALPAAPLIYPALLEEPIAPAPQTNCAQAMIDNAQSLMVNQAIAAIAGQYLYQIVTARRLITYRTTIDLASLTMRSEAITAANLSRDTGVPERTLWAKARKCTA